MNLPPKLVDLFDAEGWEAVHWSKKETAMNKYQEENLVERLVTYTLELEGKFYIIKNVPARVNIETGEQFFSPTAVERLQGAILEHVKPQKVIQTPVYEYSEMTLQ